MGVVVVADAIRRKGNHLVEGHANGVQRLQRQSVDQVEVQRAEAPGTNVTDQFTHILDALLAIDGSLYGWVEILDAQTQTIEAQPANQLDACAIDRARINLDGVVTGIRIHQIEVVGRVMHQFGEFGIVQECRRAAPQMQLRHRALVGDTLQTQQCHFLAQMIQVLPHGIAIARDDLVAPAVVAGRAAERNVNVDRHRGVRRAFSQRLQVVLRPRGAELRGGRVRGVTRPRPVVFAQQVGDLIGTQ